MRIDFHTHGKLAKKIPFSSQYTDWVFSEARILKRALKEIYALKGDYVSVLVNEVE